MWQSRWIWDWSTESKHHVPSAHSSQCDSKLFIFEDNEAVIKMIIKGRSPTMRHVSRTHRVAPDWLFDRINFDPKIQIRYVDTKNQQADILTKGSFTKDEWNFLLRLLSIMNPSMFSRSHSVILFQIHGKPKANESCAGWGKAKKLGVSSSSQLKSLEWKE